MVFDGFFFGFVLFSYMLKCMIALDFLQLRSLQAGIESKKNLRERFGNYGGLKLEYFWVVKSKKAKSFIRG